MNQSRLIDIAVKTILFTAVVILFVFHLDSAKSLVYVDAQKLLVGYKGMELARKEYEGKANVWKSNLDTLNQEFQSKVKEYEATKNAMTPREKKLMEDLLTSKQEQFVNYQQAIKERAQKEDQEMTAKVLDKVNDYLKRYGKEKGYTIILAATQYGNIVYAKEGIDITEDVLKGLNAEFAK